MSPPTEIRYVSSNANRRFRTREECPVNTLRAHPLWHGYMNMLIIP